jgi:hypothetical protein
VAGGEREPGGCPGLQQHLGGEAVDHPARITGVVIVTIAFGVSVVNASGGHRAADGARVLTSVSVTAHLG